MKINKKNLLALLGLSLVLGACSNEELPAVVVDADEAREVSIKLTLKIDGEMQLVGRGDASEYTGPRQMLTQRSQQCVNDVRIYIFGSDSQDGDFLFEANKIKIKDEQGIEKDVLANGDGSYLVTSEGVFDNKTPWEGSDYETHNYEIKPRLKSGRYYKFLAVGRDDKYAPVITPEIWLANYPWWFGHKTLKDIEFIDGVTNFEEASIEVRRNTDMGGLYEPNYVTELFSGCLSNEDDENKDKTLEKSKKIVPKSIYLSPDCNNFVGSIFLRRAVAGLYARITNIPCHVTDDKTGIEFIPFEVNLLLSVCATKTNLVYREDASEEHFNDVIVGQVDFRYTTVFNDKNWTNNGEIYLREPGQYKDMYIPANTTMMSNFLMPVNVEVNDASEATLIIQYYTSLNNGHLIFSQKLNCSIVSVWDIEGGATGPVDQPKDSTFKIEANKLYVLCEDFDINKPIDLSKVSRFSGEMPNGSEIQNPSTNPEDNPETPNPETPEETPEDPGEIPGRTV